MNLEDFVSYCETPGVGATGKGTSYRNAIQYLCTYLGISVYSFSSADLSRLQSEAYAISNPESDLYKGLMKSLTRQGRSSYLKMDSLELLFLIFSLIVD